MAFSAFQGHPASESGDSRWRGCVDALKEVQVWFLYIISPEKDLEMEEEEEGSQVNIVTQVRGCVPFSCWNPMYLELVNIYFSNSGGPA